MYLSVKSEMWACFWLIGHQGYFLSSQDLSIVRQGTSEESESKGMSFSMRSWFRAPGWALSYFLFSGTVGSYPEELVTLCCVLTSQSQ